MTHGRRNRHRTRDRRVLKPSDIRSLANKRRHVADQGRAWRPRDAWDEETPPDGPGARAEQDEDVTGD